MFKKLTAVLITSTLILTAPGLGFYEAWAMNVQGAAKGIPMSGANLGAVAGSVMPDQSQQQLFEGFDPAMHTEVVAPVHSPAHVSPRAESSKQEAENQSIVQRFSSVFEFISRALKPNSTARSAKNDVDKVEAVLEGKSFSSQGIVAVPLPSAAVNQIQGRSQPKASRTNKKAVPEISKVSKGTMYELRFPITVSALFLLISVNAMDYIHSTSLSPELAIVGFLGVGTIPLFLWNHFHRKSMAESERLYKLGQHYYYGKNRKSRNYAKAASLFRQAAKMGNIQAQYKMGMVYETGRGVSKNLVEAYKWYTLAAASRESWGTPDFWLGHLGPDPTRKIDRLESKLIPKIKNARKRAQILLESITNGSASNRSEAAVKKALKAELKYVNEVLVKVEEMAEARHPELSDDKMSAKQYAEIMKETAQIFKKEQRNNAPSLEAFKTALYVLGQVQRITDEGVKFNKTFRELEHSTASNWIMIAMDDLDQARSLDQMKKAARETAEDGIRDINRHQAIEKIYEYSEKEKTKKSFTSKEVQDLVEKLNFLLTLSSEELPGEYMGLDELFSSIAKLLKKEPRSKNVKEAIKAAESLREATSEGSINTQPKRDEETKNLKSERGETHLEMLLGLTAIALLTAPLYAASLSLGLGVGSAYFVKMFTVAGVGFMLLGAMSLALSFKFHPSANLNVPLSAKITKNTNRVMMTGAAFVLIGSILTLGTAIYLLVGLKTAAIASSAPAILAMAPLGGIRKNTEAKKKLSKGKPARASEIAGRSKKETGSNLAKLPEDIASKEVEAVLVDSDTELQYVHRVWGKIHQMIEARYPKLSQDRDQMSAKQYAKVLEEAIQIFEKEQRENAPSLRAFKTALYVLKQLQRITNEGAKFSETFPELKERTSNGVILTLLLVEPERSLDQMKKVARKTADKGIREINHQRAIEKIYEYSRKGEEGERFTNKEVQDLLEKLNLLSPLSTEELELEGYANLEDLERLFSSIAELLKKESRRKNVKEAIKTADILWLKIIRGSVSSIHATTEKSTELEVKLLKAARFLNGWGVNADLELHEKWFLYIWRSEHKKVLKLFKKGQLTVPTERIRFIADSPRGSRHKRVTLSKGLKRGTVSFSLKHRGYGEITPEDKSTNVFMDDKESSFTTLKFGDKVYFKITNTDKGRKAVHIKKIAENAAMANTVDKNPPAKVSKKLKKDFSAGFTLPEMLWLFLGGFGAFIYVHSHVRVDAFTLKPHPLTPIVGALMMSAALIFLAYPLFKKDQILIEKGKTQNRPPGPPKTPKKRI